MGGRRPAGRRGRRREDRSVSGPGPTARTRSTASGGLIGAGHPVGCTGVRQLLDCYKQVTCTAGDYQVEGAKTFQTLNIGGSGTTSVSFVVG
jgi:acetyl-CoA C-acetyltransferase